jgi:hypothetical protein
MVSDHPLLGYIEDAFSPNHIQAYKKLQARLQKSHPNCQLGAGDSLFGSDLDKIKQVTKIIVPEPKEDEEESEKQLTPEEQEALEEAKREEDRKQAEAAAKAASAKGKPTSSKKEETLQSTVSAE